MALSITDIWCQVSGKQWQKECTALLVFEENSEVGEKYTPEVPREIIDWFELITKVPAIENEETKIIDKIIENENDKILNLTKGNIKFVDVSSSLESSPGEKNIKKIKNIEKRY